ncbi:hypothetical protein BJ085DRAFT_37036 [Dimargaris cristalligena]|uniref:Uncharacterized protein n=1 Tax=Dimargaris cristalligena TaxID=215637 RepID=A0A4P9ZUR3_9FUNG|nr:hypothetical protein BJ085DRAFT_37036 [Dimargaris cristalligena]|eukprot:RKP37297.1 hypothetical protein BJ085DRAFT_37036 [Dimargaris cristalligena]
MKLSACRVSLMGLSVALWFMAFTSGNPILPETLQKIIDRAGRKPSSRALSSEPTNSSQPFPKKITNLLRKLTGPQKPKKNWVDNHAPMTISAELMGLGVGMLASVSSSANGPLWYKFKYLGGTYETLIARGTIRAAQWSAHETDNQATTLQMFTLFLRTPFHTTMAQMLDESAANPVKAREHGLLTDGTEQPEEVKGDLVWVEYNPSEVNFIEAYPLAYGLSKLNPYVWGQAMGYAFAEHRLVDMYALTSVLGVGTPARTQWLKEHQVLLPSEQTAATRSFGVLTHAMALALGQAWRDGHYTAVKTAIQGFRAVSPSPKVLIDGTFGRFSLANGDGTSPEAADMKLHQLLVYLAAQANEEEEMVAFAGELDDLTRSFTEKNIRLIRGMLKGCIRAEKWEKAFRRLDILWSDSPAMKMKPVYCHESLYLADNLDFTNRNQIKIRVDRKAWEHAQLGPLQQASSEQGSSGIRPAVAPLARQATDESLRAIQDNYARMFDQSPISPANMYPADSDPEELTDETHDLGRRLTSMSLHPLRRVPPVDQQWRPTHGPSQHNHQCEGGICTYMPIRSMAPFTPLPAIPVPQRVPHLDSGYIRSRPPGSNDAESEVLPASYQSQGASDMVWGWLENLHDSNFDENAPVDQQYRREENHLPSTSARAREAVTNSEYTMATENSLTDPANSSFSSSPGVASEPRGQRLTHNEPRQEPSVSPNSWLSRTPYQAGAVGLNSNKNHYDHHQPGGKSSSNEVTSQFDGTPQANHPNHRDNEAHSIAGTNFWDRSLDQDRTHGMAYEGSDVIFPSAARPSITDVHSNPFDWFRLTGDLAQDPLQQLPPWTLGGVNEWEGWPSYTNRYADLQSELESEVERYGVNNNDQSTPESGTNQEASGDSDTPANQLSPSHLWPPAWNRRQEPSIQSETLSSVA